MFGFIDLWAAAPAATYAESPLLGRCFPVTSSLHRSSWGSLAPHQPRAVLPLNPCALNMAAPVLSFWVSDTTVSWWTCLVLLLPAPSGTHVGPLSRGWMDGVAFEVTFSPSH